MILISEYQDGTRNARVYKRDVGDYYVLLYDSYYDYEGFHVWSNLETAEDYAENWVLLH